MNELIFEIEMLLCQRFPSLSPLQLDQYPAEEFFKMVRDLNEYSERVTDGREDRPRGKGGSKKVYKVKVMDG